MSETTGDTSRTSNTPEATPAAGRAPMLVVHDSVERMARATAARLVTAVTDAQTARGTASLVLTGGRNGTAVLAAVAHAPGLQAVDWSRVDVWWGDERFLPEGDPERNHTQARAALLDALPLDPARVHPMPAAGGSDAEPATAEAAARAYAADLAGAAPFDVLLLGVGPDAHVASLFPGHPAAAVTDRTVVAVPDAPKPPPVRISLTLPTLCTAREVWLLAAGADKADAVAWARDPDPAPGPAAPAAAARGTVRTLLLTDSAAADEGAFAD